MVSIDKRLKRCDMKVVAFNGSAKKDGNTAMLILRVLQVLEGEGRRNRVNTTGL
jgi:hypothetical protein